MLASSCIFPIELPVTDPRFFDVLPVLLRYRVSDVLIPCGQCSFCRGSLSSQWAVRLSSELKFSDFAHFIALSSTVPVSRYQLQLFFSRLRDALFHHRVGIVDAGGIASGLRLKYYVSSGYFSGASVASFHGIFFNLPAAVLDQLKELWSFGCVFVLPVSSAAIGLVTGCVSIVFYDDFRPVLRPLVSFGLRVNHAPNINAFNEDLPSYLLNALAVKVRRLFP